MRRAGRLKQQMQKLKQTIWQAVQYGLENAQDVGGASVNMAKRHNIVIARSQGEKDSHQSVSARQMTRIRQSSTTTSEDQLDEELDEEVKA